MNAVHYLARCMSTQAASACAFLRAPSGCSPALRFAFFLFTVLVLRIANAGVLEGSVTFPGRAVPGSSVYARNIETGALHEMSLRRGERLFQMELPAGHYRLFMRPIEPGLAELYGAYTRYSICRRTTPATGEQACADHSLQDVEVPANGSLTGISLDDWFLDDAQAAELDRILGANAVARDDSTELGRPRFSEYRTEVRQIKPPANAGLQGDPRAAPFSEQLGQAAAAGPNFAGAFGLAQLACGDGCRQVAVVDIAAGSVVFPDQLARLSPDLPCRADRALVFRDDSRLLEYTHRAGDAVITDYLLWDLERRNFSALAQYRRSLERFCSAQPAA